ncbi:restriction endonuclease subunit S [Fictibacillus arsenicus]|uniref:Type I restriction modification DNA specificity domain-containing protein n=1 Tax=Fictibacillus arsenicus TaxID=255247 RepID=A0A1V3GAZ8_9BACL|nr:restriction endonuclease subunit S [Fictibacillus arsenicus]OOE14025.1 hypothetical protein UN64_02090 [Fictibacillus arsenicus]
MKNPKLTKYVNYKDSEIEWIGKVPSNWEVKRLKEISEINKRSLSEKTPASYEFNYIDIGSVAYGEKGFTTERMNFKEAPSRAKRIVKKGDIIISTVRTYLKAITSIDEDVSDLICSTGFAVISPNKGVFNKYYSYFITSDIFVNEICAQSKGVSYPATNSSVIGDLFCLIPPYTEQKAIADYLDVQLIQIDRKIDLLTQKAKHYNKLKLSLIDETVMQGFDKNAIFKDCGIDWIGDIPNHWKIKRLKELGFLYSGLSGKKGEDFTDEHKYSSNFIPFVNIANNQFISTNDMKKVVIYPNEKQNKVSKNDLFFLMSSENHNDIGKSALLKEELPNTYLNSFCRGFRITKKGIDPNFINYLLTSQKYRNRISVEGKGFTRINLKIEKLNDLILIIPPYSEQKAISDYLDIKTAQINLIVKTIHSQISKLKELRKNIINDVVTGKIKVAEEGVKNERTALSR